MSHHTTCPDCFYTRKDTDVAPEWQCPSCQKAYAKTGGSLQAHVPNGYVTSLNSPRESSVMKWLCITGIIVVASFFLWPAQPESRLYGVRNQVKDRFTSFGSVVGLSSSSEDDRQTIANKMAELQAYEAALQKVENDIATARANVGTCSITGQPNQFILNKDPRPEVQARIDTLKEEIRVLEKKM